MKVVIIGCGPAGMMCATCASQNINNEIILIDSNEKIGKKLFITGKGRCNVTNLCSNEDFLKNVVRNPKFLYSAINTFNSSDTISFFESNGVRLKVERGNRVFPQSDKSSDIIKCFSKLLNRKNIELKLNCKVQKVEVFDNGFKIFTKDGEIIANCLVIATGGKSYHLTGSAGDGYIFAKNLGHNIVELKPALVPIILNDYNGELAGLTLKNVEISVDINGKKFSQFGELLFTHNGISGPTVLTLSSYINRFNISGQKIVIDLKPALSYEKLENRLIRDFSNNSKLLKNYLKELLPSSLIELFMKKCDFNTLTCVNNINKEDRKKICRLLKNFSFNIKNLDNIDYAIVTSGGVDVREINPKTMESKIIKNLFIVGEILDVDALTGGFNIQIALSTGYCAGNYIKTK